MALRYVYNEKKYTTLQSLRHAIWQTQKVVYGNLSTPEEFAKIGVSVTTEEYDPRDELSLDTLRTQVLSQMKSAFNAYCDSTDTAITTSLGFSVNANMTAVLNLDICIAQLEQGLVITQADTDPTIEFRDFNNEVHALTLEQLKQVKAEIANNLSKARSKKWEYESAIKSADRETLKSMHITFS